MLIQAPAEGLLCGVLNVDVRCLELFNLISFRPELRGTPSGKGGNLENPTKTGSHQSALLCAASMPRFGGRPANIMFAPSFFPLRVVPSDSLSPLPFPPLPGFSRILSELFSLRRQVRLLRARAIVLLIPRPPSGRNADVAGSGARRFAALLNLYFLSSTVLL